MTAILRWSPCVTMVIRRDAVRLCYEDTKIPGHIRHPKRKKKRYSRQAKVQYFCHLMNI